MDLEPHRTMDVLVLASSLDAMFQKAKMVGVLLGQNIILTVI